MCHQITNEYEGKLAAVSHSHILCWQNDVIIIFDQSIWECNGHFDHWFSNTTKAFLCGLWNLRREKLYPLGLSDLVLHSSINQYVVNDRTFMRYLSCLHNKTSLWQCSIRIVCVKARDIYLEH